MLWKKQAGDKHMFNIVDSVQVVITVLVWEA